MRARRIATKRAVLHRAWLIAKRRIDRDGVAQLEADEEAGRLLAQYGEAIVAHTLCKVAVACELLAEVVSEEGGAILPPGRNAS